MVIENVRWTDIPGGILSGGIQRWLVALGPDAGRVMTRLNLDPEFATRVAALFANLAAIPKVDKSRTSLNPQWLRAREIMGQNFFGVEEAITHFGVSPSEQQIDALAKIKTPAKHLISEKELVKCKDSHILSAVFLPSILDIREKVKHELFLSHEDAWYNNIAFAKEMGNRVGWYLIHKTLLGDTEGDHFEPRVTVYSIIGHFLATGERLYERMYARCSGGIKVSFKETGLSIWV